MQHEADLAEVEDLKAILARPWIYQERRVERLTFLTDRHFRVSTRQQFWLPGTGCQQSMSTVLLPLGIFDKARRPTLEAYSSSGEPLPILSRYEQAAILSYLAFRRAALELADQGVPKDNLVQTFAELRPNLLRLVACSSEDASTAYEDILISLEKRQKASEVAFRLLNDSHIHNLKQLVSVSQVLVRLRASESTQVVIEHHYSESFTQGRRHPDPSWSARAAWRQLWARGAKDSSADGQTETGPVAQPWCRNLARARVLGSVLADTFRLIRNLSFSLITRISERLCLLPTVIGRSANNANHCDSYYLLIEPPAGTVCARYYWETLECSSTASEEMSGESWHSDVICLGAHHSQVNPDNGFCYFELRPSRSLAHWLAMFLAIVSAVVSYGFAFEWIESNAIPSRLTALLTALPGALTGALTRNASRESRSVTSGLVFMGILVAGLSLAMGILESAGGEARESSEATVIVGHWDLVEIVPIVSGTASTGLALILLWIVLLSRLFDGPAMPYATFAQARLRIRLEKVASTLYLGCSCVVIWFLVRLAQSA